MPYDISFASESTPLTVSFARQVTITDADDNESITTYNDESGSDSPGGSNYVGKSTRHKHKTNQLEAFLHLLKGSVNSGCFALPWAFSSLGLPLGAFATAVACVVTTYNCIMLVRLKNRVCPGQELTYGDVGKAYLGEAFGNFVAFCVSLQQLSICMVYFSFVGTNIASVTKQMESFVTLSYQTILYITLPIALGLTLVPNLKVLAPITGLASALMMGAFASLACFIVVSWNGLSDTLPMDVNWQQAPMAACALLFSYEGICLVLPIEASMQTPERFERTMKSAATVICTIFITLASTCVLAFGEVDNGSVTAFLMDHITSFHRGRVLILAANTLVSLSVLFTFPLQIFPSLGLTAQAIYKAKQYFGYGDEDDDDDSYVNDDDDDSSADFENDSRQYSRKTSTASKVTEVSVAASTKEIEGGDSPLMRVTLVLFCWLVASIIPNVGQLIALSGAFAGCMNALVTPPILQLKYLREEKVSLFSYRTVECCLLLLGGVLLGLLGSYYSVRDVYRSFHPLDTTQ